MYFEPTIARVIPEKGIMLTRPKFDTHKRKCGEHFLWVAVDSPVYDEAVDFAVELELIEPVAEA